MVHGGAHHGGLRLQRTEDEVHREHGGGGDGDGGDEEGGSDDAGAAARAVHLAELLPHGCVTVWFLVRGKLPLWRLGRRRRRSLFLLLWCFVHNNIAADITDEHLL